MPMIVQAFLVAVAIAGSGLAACAVTGASTVTRCSVSGVKHLRADIGGPQAVFAEIEKAMPAARGHQGRSSHTLGVTCIGPDDFRRWPQFARNGTAMSDSSLNRSSFAMLARALAEELASSL